MAIATVIGNGESRKDFDINTLLGLVVGCNAVYRDITPDHLVCVDQKMVREVFDTKGIVPYPIYTRDTWLPAFRNVTYQKNDLRAVPKLPYEGKDRIDQPFHWGAGQFATLVALQEGATTIYLLGFDLYGSGKDQKLHNNVYKDTHNYWSTDRHAVPHHYWVYQMHKIFELHPNVQFYQVQPDSWILPPEWQNLANLSVINYDNLNTIIRKNQ